MKKVNECLFVIQDTELLSAIKSLKIYGGKNDKSTNGNYILCINTYCNESKCQEKNLLQIMPLNAIIIAGGDYLSDIIMRI